MRSRILTLIGATLVTTSLLAQQHPGRPARPGLPGNLGRCLEAAHLTEEQKGQTRAIIEAAGPTLRPLGAQLRTDREALRTILSSSAPEACAVGTAMLKVRSDEAAIAAEIEKLRASLEAILTAEQKLRFAGCLDGLRGHGDPGVPVD